MTGFGSTSHHIVKPARLFGPSGLGLKACILSLGSPSWGELGPEAIVKFMVRPTVEVMGANQCLPKKAMVDTK